MRRDRLLLPALLAASLVLRAIPWAADLPLHHDEALYGTWARAIADGSDPLLLIPWVDKPPLVPYLLALSLKLFGHSELALRAPGMLASILTVFGTYAFARRMVGEQAALLAGALLGLSPFAVLFGPTAFTDPWLTLFIIGAAWAAIARRPLWAGVFLGLALASKQQGVFGVPLILALLVTAVDPNAYESRRPAEILKCIGLASLGFALVFGAVTYWDSLRWHNRPSYWDQSLRTYGGVVLAPLAEWPPRAVEWARQMRYLFGVPAISVLLLLVAGVSVWPGCFADLYRLIPKLPGHSTALRERGSLLPKSAMPANKGMVDAKVHQPRRGALLLAGYVLCYLLVHLAFTFQPWDRYLLPVLPLICVLAGRGLLIVWSASQSVRQPHAERWVAAALALVLVYAASLGVTARIPVGSDIGAYDGVAAAAHFLARQPAGTTVYYDRLGWHLGYYLYDLPIRRSWYDGPAKLAREAARVADEQSGAPQWLMLPRWELDSLAALEDALAGQGLAALPDAAAVTAGDTAGPTLFRIEKIRAIASTAGSSAERTP